MSFKPRRDVIASAARHAGVILFAAAFCSLTAFAQNAAVTINVDASANRHAIRPEIYGVAYATTEQLADLNVPINRQGGNATSSYNWQLNATNRGADWYFESVPESSSTAGEAGDTFITASRAGGAEPMITVPMLDWVARLGTNRGKLAAFSQSKYGAQTGNDAQWFPDAGNGVLKSTGRNVTGNDPHDANTPAGVSFQSGWLAHLTARWGSSGGGGVRYFILDNEPSLWQATHREVKPTGATMDEIRQKMIDYGTMVKSADPGAAVVGPEEWGWSGYFWSGFDQQYAAANGWCCYPDRSAHGGLAYMPWLLDQLRQYETQSGRRVLDVFSLHYYPQGGEYSDDTSPTLQQLRNRSTRSLWDPNYVDQTWINDKVMLIPRMKSWVASYYPGLKTAITEYNWGAEGHINGATTQADILGIFGREGLDLAARWTTPAASTPTYKAIKLYRNYDGAKSTFGDTSVAASVPNPDNMSAFAAVRSIDGALTVMVVSKQLSGATPVTLNLANYVGGGTAKVWQLTSANTIVRLSDVAVSANSLTTSLPAQSVTLFVIGGGMAANVPPDAVIQATPTSGTAPLVVMFNGSLSSDPDGKIAGYAWNFGNSTNASGPTATISYANPGTYVATLTVTDDRGSIAASSINIEVGAADSTAIAPPSGLSARVARGGVVTLRWIDNSGNEQGFAVERAPAGGTTFALVGQTGPNGTSFSQTVARGNYVYRVRAYNLTTARTSPYSNSVSVKVTGR